MRPIWTGSLSFGLVHIPVRLYHAVEERGVSFHMLHKKDLSPIRFARICKADGQEVPYKDIVKGYEYEKGEYVILTEDELMKLNPEKTKTIDIVDFAGQDQIDPIYFAKTYYLEPDKGAAKPYSLLWQALGKTGKVGLAKFILHAKEHIGLIKPHKNILVLQQLHYQTEIRESDDITVPKEKTSPKEVEMAVKLIDQLTHRFDPKQYKDTYTDEVLHLVQQKAKGKPKLIAKKGKAAPAPAVKDLMGMLKASLQQTKPSNRRPHR